MSQILRQYIPPHEYKQHFSSIYFKTSFSNCVKMALLNRKWKQYQSGQSESTKQQSNSNNGASSCSNNNNNTWHLQWCQKQRINDVFTEGISSNQRVNHFRLYTQLCRKDMLMKNVRKYKYELRKKNQLNQQQWNFLPATYFLPSQYIMFVQQFKKSGGLWILKPTGRCQGSGIFIVDKLSQVAPYRFKPQINTDSTSGTGTTSTTATNKTSKQSYSGKKQAITASKTKTKAKHNNMNNQSSSQQQSQQQQQYQKQNIQQQKQQQTQQDAPINQNFIIQKYIDKPLLFGCKKFDMRIYVLCTDYRNLTVWLYRNGFARFTHEPYNTDDINNLGGHLTNVQIQKHCDNYDNVRGGKWLLNQFKLFLISKYGIVHVNKCFEQIKQIIINSLKAVKSKLISSKSSFQLYGYDFMLDSQLTPWLIQVNGGPSMTANTELDCKLKCGIVDDVLSILDLQGYMTGKQMTVGGFDLIMLKDIKIREPAQSDYRTLLGTMNQRNKVMKNIAKQFLKRKQQQQKQKKLKEKLAKQQREKKQERAAINSNKQKLLPNFYYQRKQGQINNNIIQQLKAQLLILENSADDSIGNMIDNEQQCSFVPLGGLKAR